MAEGKYWSRNAGNGARIEDSISELETSQSMGDFDVGIFTFHGAGEGFGHVWRDVDHETLQGRAELGEW